MYLLFGVGTTVVNYAMFYFMNLLLGESLATVSNVVCFVSATTFAYATNKLFVFRSRNWEAAFVAKEALSFVSSRLFSFAVEELGILICANLVHTGNYTVLGFSGTMIAKVILSFVAVVINYFFSKYLVFKKRRGTK